MILPKSIALISTATVAAFTLAACSGEAQSPTSVTETKTSTSTVTKTTPAETPAPVTVTATETETPEPEPTEDDSFVDEEVAAAALDITWDGMTSEEQDDVCLSWTTMSETSLDIFMENAGDIASRQQVKDFFDGKCGVA